MAKYMFGCLILFSCFAAYTFAATCSTTTKLSSSGSIYSPGWPFKYGNDVAKCWRITAPLSNYVVRLSINTLNMEACSGCKCDYIELFDGYSEFSSSLGKFCTGNWRITSSGRYLYVKFVSDSAGVGDAFSASYVTLQKSNTYNNNNNNNININNNNDDNKKKDDGGNKTIVYIGSGIGSFIGFVIFLCICCCLCGGGS
ncbi:procollagen C-endopeptidase enhancer 1-like [Dendronephthya gigantea]|uniref:procollagen C-endopeptidase enhancer 1-like n=1 Tax=Dendronephthya gigantea TaxID=151771 RepID=UPI00106B4A31|nr:procollagen C-endopeptidase enhancer 1-like [Dendronephthya gigantea]